MKIDTESKMKFDEATLTEERFALRKWFQKFIDFQNIEDADSVLVFLHPECKFEGWGKHTMKPETLAAFLERRNFSDVQYVVRYPELVFKKRGNAWRVNGSYEEYKNNSLCLEGMIDITVVKQNNVYLILKHKFFPRLIIRTEEYDEAVV